MAFDEQLGDRIRAALETVADVEERRMFGGLAFMIGGHMACGIVGSDLMVRLGEQDTPAALAMPHVRPMDFTGRASRTMVFVDQDGISDDEKLAGWVRRGVDHARTLPAKDA